MTKALPARFKPSTFTMRLNHFATHAPISHAILFPCTFHSHEVSHHASLGDYRGLYQTRVFTILRVVAVISHKLQEVILLLRGK